jgi:hypothetical protein
VEFSPKSELTALCIFFATLAIPIILSCMPLPGQMVVAGNSSAAISAACHVTWQFVDGQTPCNNEHDLTTDSSDGINNIESGYQLVPMADGSKTLHENIKRKVQGKLKWGVVIENLATIDTENGEERPVGHLSFGVEGDNVGAVVNGAYYAGVD